MAVLAEEGRGTTLVELAPAADPAPLGLAAFALTTFMLSGHNASFIPDTDSGSGSRSSTAGSCSCSPGCGSSGTATSSARRRSRTYGGFWLGLGVRRARRGDEASRHACARPTSTTVGVVPARVRDLQHLHAATGLAGSALAVFLVFLTLEITEILLAIGIFNLGTAQRLDAARRRLGRDRDGGCAWYTSAAGVINGMGAGVFAGRAGRSVGPVDARLAEALSDADERASLGRRGDEYRPAIDTILLEERRVSAVAGVRGAGERAAGDLRADSRSSGSARAASGCRGSSRSRRSTSGSRRTPSGSSAAS